MRAARTKTAKAVAAAERGLEARPKSPSAAWLVLFHHVPPRPDYLRVRIGRSLKRLGALALKNSVYVLPNAAVHRASFASLAREILERGGEAITCEAAWVEGITDEALRDRFREARNVEYLGVSETARGLASSLRGRRVTPIARRRVAHALSRLRRSFEDVLARDAFGASGRDQAATLISLVQDLLEGVEGRTRVPASAIQPPRGARWVTRTGVMIDRIASAWLIRRFIDPAARFKFVTGHGYRPAPGELRFDMSGGEFTHEGDRCTFEVLLERFRLRDSTLGTIAEIVHDLDLGDARYERPECQGVGRMIVGIALNTPDDALRLEQGATLLDGLYESFRRTGAMTGAATSAIIRGEETP